MRTAIRSRPSRAITTTRGSPCARSRPRSCSRAPRWTCRKSEGGMKAPAFAYVAPKSLDEALRALHEVENSRVLAGGQSLMAMLNMRFAFPDCLVDINGIRELSYI